MTMRVKLLNGSGYGSSEGVDFPVEAKGKPYYNSARELCGVDIDATQLKSLGFDVYGDYDLYFSFKQGDCERLPEPEKGVTVCSITDKCCNQFGERDEIQTIINSLQADVVARGNRITELERAIRETIGYCESTNQCDESVRLLREVLRDD